MSINLDAIQARVDAATEGPWKAENLEQDHGHKGIFWVSVDHQHQIKTVAEVDSNDGGIEAIWRMPDAEFIAAARTDVPALLAYARDLEARIADLQTKENTLPGFEPLPCPDCGSTFPHHSDECINA